MLVEQRSNWNYLPGNMKCQFLDHTWILVLSKESKCLRVTLEFFGNRNAESFRYHSLLLTVVFYGGNVRHIYIYSQKSSNNDYQYLDAILVFTLIVTPLISDNNRVFSLSSTA